MGKWVLVETDAEKAIRLEKEVARKIKIEIHLKKMEEDKRLEVPRLIESLLKESDEKKTEADKLKSLFGLFPDLRRYTGRWKKIVFYSKDVNSKVTGYDRRHNCGCCEDSTLEIWPYFESSLHDRVYSDPPCFRIGSKKYGGGYDAGAGWDEEMRKAGIPEMMIKELSLIFVESESESE